MPPWMRAVLDGYASGTKKLPAINLTRRAGRKQRRKWYLSFPYDIEVVTHDRVAGRSLFVRRPPTEERGFLRCWVEFDRGAPWYEDLEWKSVVSVVYATEKRRQSVQWKYRCDDGPTSRKGHGRRRATEAFEELSKKRERQQKTFNEQRSLHIVNTAIRWKCETIEIEDLRKAPAENLALATWPYHQIYKRLTDLCELHQIVLKVVDPIEVIEKEFANATENGERTGKRKGRTATTAGARKGRSRGNRAEAVAVE
jgi:transposase